MLAIFSAVVIGLGVLVSRGVRKWRVASPLRSRLGMSSAAAAAASGDGMPPLTLEQYRPSTNGSVSVNVAAFQPMPGTSSTSANGHLPFRRTLSLNGVESTDSLRGVAAAEMALHQRSQSPAIM